MSLPRPTGLKPPTSGSKLARPAQKSGLMQPGSLSRAQSAIAKSARAAGLNASVAQQYAADTVHALSGEEELSTPQPGDDFIIGDRVYVSGSKRGLIAFLGETQFAPGEWAGVVLDETIGKNDGAVSGVRYFQCEPKRGVFCRVSKLSRTPFTGDDNESVNGDNNNTPAKRATTPSMSHRSTTPSMSHRPTTPSHESRLQRPTTPSLPRPVHKSHSSSNTSLNKGPEPAKVKSEINATSTPMASGARHKLTVGDRVLVSGSKLGTLRYVGPADFAKGEWSGVELDDPLGKNDGAVAGKRYFECRPRYGLFAPVHKVTKVPSGTATPSPMTRSMPSTGLRLSRERSGSQESVSSMSSATSSASRPRAAGRTGQRPSTLNITATTSALQKALKEKEEHIEQLLRERDLERSEVARAAAQVDETQDEMSHLRQEKERLQEETEENLQQLKARIAKLQADKHDLQEKLEDERRKNEDLQFQIEEEVISKDDLESRTEEEEAKIRDLEKNLKREKEKTEKYEQEVAALKGATERQTSQLAAMEETQTSYLDQVEELTHKLSQAEMKLQSHDSSRVEEGAKTSQIGLDLAEKTARLSELEDILSMRTKEVKQLQEKLAEMREETESRNAKFDKLQQTVEELTNKLKANEVQTNDLSKEAQNLRSQNADLQRQYENSEERCNQYVNEKMELERQIAEMMKNSGDSSNQLSMLNEQLSQKNRKLEGLQADLSTSTQKWHNLNNQLETSMIEKHREIDILTTQHEEVKASLTCNLEDVQKELEKTKTKIVAMETDFESEKAAALQRKDAEIGDLKQQLEVAMENVSKEEIQTQAHRQLLEKITLEKEAVQFEKDKLEKQIKRLEHERDGTSNELIQLRVSMSKMATSAEDWSKERTTLTDQIHDLTEQKERAEKNHAELQKVREDLTSEKEKVSSERDQYQREVMEGRASLQQKDMLVEELQKEAERLRGETSQQQEMIRQLSDKTTDVGVMQTQLAEQKTLVEKLQRQLVEQQARHEAEVQKQQAEQDHMRALKIELEESQETVSLLEESVKEVEVERDGLKAQLQTALEARQEHGKLLELNKVLNEEIETIHQRHRKEMDTLQTARDSLKQEVDNAKQQVDLRQDEITTKLTQISNLENENSMLIGYKSSNEKLEREKAELHDQINKLQTQLSESQSNANVINNLEHTTSGTVTTATNGIVDKLKEQQDESQSQIEFLNSVIVDLQRKNTELKTRLEVMELGVHNGAGDEDIEPLTPSRRAAPRAFCDICDVFDQHETEDCPQQEMDDSPPPSHHHGDRKQVRPYCDICEEFHEPCGGLSVRKVAEKGAEPLDPKEFVEDWVKKVDTVKTELEAESQKMFGNDQEFYHVQQDPSSLPGFRDSGYYDGSVVDLRTSLDGKSGLKALEDALKVTEAERKCMVQEIAAENDNVDGTASIEGGKVLKNAVEAENKLGKNEKSGRRSLEKMAASKFGRGSEERQYGKDGSSRSSVERQIGTYGKRPSSIERQAVKGESNRSSVDRQIPRYGSNRSSVEKDIVKGESNRSSVEKDIVKGESNRSSVEKDIVKGESNRSFVEKQIAGGESNRSSEEREMVKGQNSRGSLERQIVKPKNYRLSAERETDKKQNIRSSEDRDSVKKQNVRSSEDKDVVKKKDVTASENNNHTETSVDNEAEKRPDELNCVSDQVDNKPEVETPSSVANDNSDSEYQSGRESLASDDSPTAPATPDMETSVDTGVASNSDEPVEGQGDMDKSCIVS